LKIVSGRHARYKEFMGQIGPVFKHSIQVYKANKIYKSYLFYIPV